MGSSSSHPDAPTFADLVRAYIGLIRRTARRWGVPATDVPDCAQEVCLRLYRAIVDRRLDTSRSIARWLIKTTGTVARDLRMRGCVQHEVTTAPDDLDVAKDTTDPEERVTEAFDVHDVIDRILDKLTPEQRDVFVMSDLEDTPMPEVIAALKIAKSTAYERLKVARQVFAREWEAMRKSGSANLAPFALLSVAELLSAEHEIPDVPPGFTDDLLRRLSKELRQDFTGLATSAVAAGTSVATGAARAGTITLTTWQIGLGALLVGLAGAGLAAAPRPSRVAPAPAATVMTQAPSVVTTASTATPLFIDPAPPPPGAMPDDRTTPATPAPAIQTRLLENARTALSNHQPAKALALLARVTAPDLAEERDELHRRALAQQAATTTSTTSGTGR